MSTTSDQSPAPASPESRLAIYSEICTTYRAIDDFRMKLLGLLPFASLAGIVLLDKNNALLQRTAVGEAAGGELAGFACLFASVFTLTLFVYEIRGILRSHGLIKRGADIEDALNVRGQFGQCNEEAGRSADSSKHGARLNRDRTERSFKNAAAFFNSTVASCLVYSVVFTAWLFLALRYAYGWKLFGCAVSAFTLGVLIGGGAYFLVRRAVPA